MQSRTLEQTRARKALASYQRVADELGGPGAGGDGPPALHTFGRLVESFPAMLQPGILPAVGILHAGRAKGPQQCLLRELTAWLEDPECPLTWSSNGSQDQGNLLVRLLAEPDRLVLWNARREAMRFVGWLKIFVRSYE